jgi:hypothetical protein
VFGVLVQDKVVRDVDLLSLTIMNFRIEEI